jgi:endonuclease G
MLNHLLLQVVLTGCRLAACVPAAAAFGRIYRELIVNALFRTFLIVLFAAIFSAGCTRLPDALGVNSGNSAPANAAAPATALEALPFGNPTNAAAADPDNYLIVHESHVLSYNSGRGTPNWVAWFTRASDLGESIPRPLFQPDPSLPPKLTRIQHGDYSGSGYDRGHMLPSADRFADRRLNEQTFYMTNIVPQTMALNQFPWQKLESYARSLARRGNTVYTVAGVYGDAGRLKGRVTVPANCWKVIVVFPRGSGIEFTNRTRVIAVDMPNIDGIENEDWKRYKTTVREIEQRAGVDLFSALPRGIQETIETRPDPDQLHNR